MTLEMMRNNFFGIVFRYKEVCIYVCVYMHMHIHKLSLLITGNACEGLWKEEN